MVRASKPWIALAAAALLAGCATPPPPAPVPQPQTPEATPLTRDCDALVQAAPGEWTERLAAVHRAGHAAAGPLVAALERSPAGAGAQAAVALLGRIGDPAAGAYLVGLVEDRGDLAMEAALALGELRHEAARPTLIQCATDRFADATLRTAAACSAVRLGARREVADILRGVMLAGTPAGQRLGKTLGLPGKPRWAYERYLIQRLLRDEAPEIESFDTDAPWSDLERAAQRLTAWLES